ncbi:hypothetical protein ACQKWADRAFT_284945 [Trichoderma austrokoningii]
MRPPAATAMALRDVARLCARCRMQASQALPATRTPTRPSHGIASSTGSSFSKALPQSYRSAAFFSSSSSSYSSSSASNNSNSDNSGNNNNNNNNNNNTSPASPPPPNHYEIFPETLPLGPPPAGHFPIDTRALRREFLQLQARHHPDRHHPRQKLRAEATSALINEAYRTLANPLLRAQYLLSLRGVDVATDETLQVDDDPSLLAVVLEAHEEISDAAVAEDLDELTAVNDARIWASEDVLERAFREDDVLAAKKEAVRLRYWVNIKQSLDDWEEGKPVVLQH